MTIVQMNEDAFLRFSELNSWLLFKEEVFYKRKWQSREQGNYDVTAIEALKGINMKRVHGKWKWYVLMFCSINKLMRHNIAFLYYCCWRRRARRETRGERFHTYLWESSSFQAMLYCRLWFCLSFLINTQKHS